jgi:hypothetical protein
MKLDCGILMKKIYAHTTPIGTGYFGGSFRTKRKVDNISVRFKNSNVINVEEE